MYLGVYSGAYCTGAYRVADLPLALLVQRAIASDGQSAQSDVSSVPSVQSFLQSQRNSRGMHLMVPPPQGKYARGHGCKTNRQQPNVNYAAGFKTVIK